MTLREATRTLEASGEKALVAFLTAGYPDEPTFLRLLEAADRAGCDVIEIGIPFSDPIADGPLIQASSKIALDGGMSLSRAIELAGAVSGKTAAPLVFMSYYNPILRMGDARFAERARDAGVSGVIIPDVPLEESAAVRGVLNDHGIILVDLVAPTSSDARIARIAGGADGFVYLVSVTGVTGVHSPERRDLAAFVGRVRKHTDLPLYVGFGISSAGKARETVRDADGVIIGSALIRIIQAAPAPDAAVEAVGEFLAGVKQSISKPFDASHSIEDHGGV